MSQTIKDKLADLGIYLPKNIYPLAKYKSISFVDNQIFVSGQLPFVDGKLISTGKVGYDVDISSAQEAAKICAINILSQVCRYVDDLQKIKKIIKITGFVAASPNFFDISKVVDAASDFFIYIFGESGKHARTSVGVYSLPMNAPVEIDAILEIF